MDDIASDKKVIKYIGIGEATIGYTNEILKISSLGSCIGLILYPTKQPLNQDMAIMGHIMLPSAGPKNNKTTNRWGPAKYADEAVPYMIKQLEKKKFKPSDLSSKIVGGANMFGHASSTLKIGKTNAKITKRLLSENDVRIRRTFTGGDTGMSVVYDVSERSLIIKQTGGEEMVI